ncbi:DnaJ domain-containing protein [Colletotrichum karsti]|uniref:Diphthamide biosynthesis protein 4 n=1 Tax=Colletotrichum karsti TaxID=1095194 RepID=A0A9P6LNJ2_9PEZI|nr:DnaJ domain-containing protein [Colletotrichum karsti]KAF9879271.1 DnaJ domain-containing protein [Colletotrichum karsti]
MSTTPPAAPGGHTHYTVLGLTRKLLQDQAPEQAQQVIKRAYHRALLQNHPDKYPQLKSQGSSSTSNPTRSTTKSETFTVDQISSAYKVLADPRSKAEYDRSLDLAPNNQGLKREQAFQTGIENVDLDDLEFDEGAECWYRNCRCGNPRGFLFTETDLEEAGENGELLVGCQDCSLWMKVHFAVVDD